MKSRKYTVNVSSKITIFYSKEKNILTIIGPVRKTSIQLKQPIFLVVHKNSIKLTAIAFSSLPNYQKKKISALKGTTKALIKQAIVETSYSLYMQLKFVGIGYRAFPVDQITNNTGLLSFKLGYSHPIFFKTEEPTKIFSLKKTKLFIFGYSYQKITNISGKIRSYKKPEPYKGKGILYKNEIIQLKEGKKI